MSFFAILKVLLELCVVKGKMKKWHPGIRAPLTNDKPNQTNITFNFALQFLSSKPCYWIDVPQNCLEIGKIGIVIIITGMCDIELNRDRLSGSKEYQNRIKIV